MGYTARALMLVPGKARSLDADDQAEAVHGKGSAWENPSGLCSWAQLGTEDLSTVPNSGEIQYGVPGTPLLPCLVADVMMTARRRRQAPWLFRNSFQHLRAAGSPGLAEVH